MHSYWKRLRFLNFKWRVWSLLRMNAGGMPNTCKFNDFMLNIIVTDGWVMCKNLRLGKGQQMETFANTLFCNYVKVLFAQARAYIWLVSWWGNSLPRLWSIANLRGRSATLGLRHGPDSYGRQQWGILDNGGNPDPAMPREWRRPSGCKALLSGKKHRL